MRVKIHNYDDIERITEISEEKISVLYISMSYFILFSIFIILLWTYFGKIDLRIKASGTIETKTESSIIINLAAGKIKNNQMRQGKKVEKGELLYEIDNENIIVERRHIKKDLEEKRNLYNAMTGKRHIKDTLVVNFFNKKQSHAIDIETLNSQIEEQEKDVYSNSEIYKIGGLSKIEFEKSKRQLKQLKDKKVQKLKEHEIQENDEKIKLASEIDELELKLKTSDEAIKNLKIASPISGYIEIISPVNNGDIIGTNLNMSKIIPEKEEYKISISVEENDILKITIGNDVNYHFNYPDESRKEIIKGKIELISRDSVVRENGKKYYTVIGNIEAKNIKNLKLKKGMTLESNIIYSKKRIIDYILEVAGFKLKRLL